MSFYAHSSRVPQIGNRHMKRALIILLCKLYFGPAARQHVPETTAGVNLIGHVPFMHIQIQCDIYLFKLLVIYGLSPVKTKMLMMNTVSYYLIMNKQYLLQ